MKTLIQLSLFLLLLNSAYAQDSLNCKLLSTTGNIINAYGLAVNGSYAFAVSDKFYILDISDIYNASVIYSDSLAPEINSVFIKDSIAYLAANDGLIIMDISSIESPEILSYLKTAEYIEEVIVHNDIAYLGTLDYAFLVIDVSDPRNPDEINRVDNNIDDVWGFDIYNNLLFAASEDTGVKIFAIADPSNLDELATLNLVPNSTAVNVKVRDNVAYVTHPRDLHAFDISDLSNPQQIFYLEGGGGKAIDIEGDYAYCITFGQLTVIDISKPDQLKIVGYYPLPADGSDIIVKNKLVFVPCQNYGIYFIQFDAPTNIEKNKNRVKDYFLSQNYPNPFNPITKINFSIPQTTFVTLKVYDILGKEISILVNEEKSIGNYEIIFDASNLSSGVYSYRVQAGNFSDTKKFVLLR